MYPMVVVYSLSINVLDTCIIYYSSSMYTIPGELVHRKSK